MHCLNDSSNRFIFVVVDIFSSSFLGWNLIPLRLSDVNGHSVSDAIRVPLQFFEQFDTSNTPSFFNVTHRTKPSSVMRGHR